MDALLESIRVAITPNANDEAKAAGASACRTILGVLETKPGHPIAPTMPSMTQLATVVSALRGLPAEQLMDLAIARLRTMVPAEAPNVRSIAIPLIPVRGR